MIQKVFQAFCIIIVTETYCCLQYSGLFENNFDLSILKENMKANNNTFQPVSHMQPVRYEDIIALKEEFRVNASKVQSSWVIKHFYLFSRDYRNGTKYELIDPRNISSIKDCHFQTRPTYILIHGFLGYGLESWVIAMKDRLLELEDSNVISVDWPAGETWFLPTYMTAAWRVSVVGNNTADLLQALMAHKGLLLENVHCLGHSLGGHVCGFTGKPFQGRVGRISGMDPAGPFFHKVNSSKRLDKTDAAYVDVIHTNACESWLYWTDCFGLRENVGHSNFFPNGGEHQPGCSDRDFGGDIGCDHKRAYELYIASMYFDTSDTYFYARPCTNWILYEVGNCTCGKSAQYMGFNVNTELDGIFYLETSSSYPFGIRDPDCSNKMWNLLVLIGYAIIVVGVICCIFCVVKRLRVETVRVNYDVSPAIDEETRRLLSVNAARNAKRERYDTY